MFAPDPVGLPGLAAFTLGALAFTVMVLVARRRRGAAAGEAGATRAKASFVGIALQGVGFFLAGFGPQLVALDPLGTEALVEAAAIALLMASAAALFGWASSTMGRNSSIVARTRADHALVQEGPFRHVRHPIYVAIALFLAALAIAFGHARQLIFAVPPFALGTWLRVQVEEKLLRDRFAGDYDAYAGRVKRFVPGLF